MAMTLPAHKDKIALIGESITTLEKNFITADMGMINLFPNVTYKKAGTGGSRIEVKTEHGIKLIELYGASNTASWKKLLGGTHYAYMADEINIFHEELLSELWVRIFRNGANLVCTSNGDMPDKPIYKEYLNYCSPAIKYINDPDIPKTTLQDLAAQDSKPGWTYYFIGFKDNPKYTEQDIKDLHSSVPKGSFRYITKILGARAAQEGAVFAELLTDKDPIVESFSQQPTIITVAIDPGNADRCSAVLCMAGFDSNFNKKFVIDTSKSEGKTHAEIVNDLIEFLISNNNYKAKHIFVDDGMKTLIYAIKQHPYFKGVSIKFAIKPKIVDRIATYEQLFHHHKVEIMNTPGNCELVNNLKKIITDGKGGYKDNGKEEIDYLDSFSYCSTPYLKKLIKI